MLYAKTIDVSELRFRPHPAAAVEASGRRVQQWVKDRGLTGSEEAFAWYCMWDTARFVGNSYPHADPGRGMDLVGKLMAVTILLDDQIDESASVGRCVNAITPFLEIVRTGGETVPRANQPLHQAFAEVLREARACASDAWWRRAARNWEMGLIAVAHETLNREVRRKPAPRDVYLDIRRSSGFMGPFLDILEPAASFEPSALAYYSPQLMLMRRITTDLGNFINDVFSLEKELARGQYDNLVLVLCEEEGITVQEAIPKALDTIHARLCRFVELRSELPAVCSHLGLTSSDTESSIRYADALEMWVAGFEPWQRTSARYTQALDQRPQHEAWARENLLGAVEPSV
ncbi:terpene synthase family protein [Streptomyces ficellus]|uniref:Terpene synthase n=1 Tax=Streptomyces ficellus TaxID=1977088 RepID=A0ABT7Z615_9ACTN|nr:terpene synthase family protein [Streptomyces ficellus]MDN3294906.1 terpene synthase family protein [Streptomyces ficellus]